MTHTLIAHKFKLYIAGDAPNSLKAVANIKAFCLDYLASCHTIEIVDVLRHPEQALADGILLTPTLVKVSPAPICKIVGNLDNSRTVLETIGL